jgi:pimeloyl-ACP methyl ester carboxylesterase
MRTRVNGVELYYEQQGEGDPVVLLHGWLDNASVWDSQIEFLAKTHKVIAYDHRGHGRSDRPRGDYSVRTLADDLHTLTQNLGLGKVALVGHSLGSMTALTFALDHPDGLSRLVLASSTARLSPVARVLGNLVATLNPIVPYRRLVRMTQRSGFYRPTEQLLSKAYERAMKTSRYAAFECMKAFTRDYDLSDRLTEVTVPTLIVVGEKDFGTTVGMARYLNSRIAGSQLHVIPDCGHGVMEERPEEFNRIVGEWLAG